MEQSVMNKELHHAGIKGMKWGVRRYQNKDGTLTPAGKARYRELTSGESAKKKSEHRSKLEARYRKEGMSNAEAVVAADRRIRTEKVLAGVAGVTVAAAATYMVTKHVRERTDQLIKSGSDFQRIESTKKLFGKNRNLHDAFYVTDNEYDNKNYQDAFGHIKALKYGKAYKLDIKATDDVKIASQKKAKDTLKDLLYNDEEFRSSLHNGQISSDLRNKHGVSLRVLERIHSKKPISDRTMKRLYENFNSNLVGKAHDNDESATRRIFYDALKKKGYSGVQDINDLKYSRLRGKNPLIIFDKSKVTVTKVEDILDKTGYESYKQAYSRMDKLRGAQSIVRALPKVAGMSVTAAAAYYMRGSHASNRKVIERYRKEHPNSKLSNKEIIDMYSKKK